MIAEERQKITNFEYVGFCSPRQCNVTNVRFDLGNFSHSSDIERREIANLDIVSHERCGRSATRRNFLMAPERLNVNGAMSSGNGGPADFRGLFLRLVILLFYTVFEKHAISSTCLRTRRHANHDLEI